MWTIMQMVEHLANVEKHIQVVSQCDLANKKLSGSSSSSATSSSDVSIPVNWIEFLNK